MAALLITVLIIAVHLVNLRRAGGLWRDEAAAVNLAQRASFGEIWSHLEHESFPLLITMLLRGWSALGAGGSDFGWRAFGLVVGVALLAALWWNAWQLTRSPPLFSLLLVGLSPTAIRWGDSLRAYGLGVLFILLSLGAIWRVVRAPSRRNVALAMIAGFCAVQALYQNAAVLAAICLSGAAVALRRRNAKRALLILSLGLPAALSLLPYLPVIRRAGQWNVATQVPIDLARIWTVLQRALHDPGPLMIWLWGGSLALAIVSGILLIAWRGRERGEREADLALYLLTAIAATTAAYYLFLKLAQFPSETWYYLVWMAVMAVALDALVARAARTGRSRLILAGAALAAAGFLLPGVWQRAQIRMTNLDLVAQQLNERVAPQDLVLVHPWFCGATFHRYYTGRAEWTTLPPLSDYGLQRLDLFKEQMQREDPIQPVLQKMETTLRAGGTVWLVGHFPFSNPPQAPPSLPRAGEGPEGWRGAPYMMAYGMQAAYFLQAHATRSTRVEVPVAGEVNPFEDLPVRTISGWRSRF